jgi:GcrA cell cycle regulator
MDWTEDMILDLSLCWLEKNADGTNRYSTAAIGRRYGVTKNVIVGKAQRLDLPRRKSPIHLPEGGQAPATGPRRPPTPPPLPPLLSAAPLLPLACEKTIVSWRAPAKPKPIPVVGAPPAPSSATYGRIAECAYPIGTPGEPGFRFCCAKTLAGKPYCGPCWDKTHQRVRQSESVR